MSQEVEVDLGVWVVMMITIMALAMVGSCSALFQIAENTTKMTKIKSEQVENSKNMENKNAWKN